MLSKLGLPLPLDPSQKLPFRLSTLAAAEFLLVLSYAIQSLPGRLSIFVPTACICLWMLACTRADFPPANHPLGWRVGIGCRVASIFLFASTSVLEKVMVGSAEKRKHSNGDSVLRNLWSGVQTWFNPRCINTASEPRSSLPPRPHITNRRSSFVIRQLLWGSFHFFLMDISTTLLHFYDIRRQTPLAPKSSLDFAFNHKFGLLTSVSYFGTLYTTLSYMHYALSAFSVGLGITNPCDWPPLFNFTFEACTLRKFWGTFWHQMFRRIFTTHADFFSELLHLPPDSQITRYFKLFCSFGLSALLHLGGDGLALQSVSKSGCVKFFMLQAAAIVLEDNIIGLTSKLPAQRNLRRLLGCLSVLIWFGSTLPIWIDPLLDAGYVDTLNQGYFSPAMGLWKGVWFRQEFNTRIWDEIFRVQNH
ncbi:membrane bound O-acyl transferase family-domain-containing protein [Crepidotus variabilis]|uniref:Membrane bound O-acyl transferase family-domain-containing protein n=1 Tax=Crepidotus variabilis TaxID=179855 RepID=A0A9P6EJR0_9AGAR|nr:membrane bound O-acyl transferase family-domain-containing protein [Crepidotus variabilis]